MTHQPDIARHAHRRALAVLLAAAALPSTALAQETVTPPTVPAPSAQTPAPAPAPAQTGESRTRIAPGVLEQAEQEAQERAAARRAERAEARPSRPARPTRAVERPEAAARAATPAPRAVPEPIAPVAPEPAAPVAGTPEVTPPPAEVAPASAEPVTTTVETPATEPAPVNGASSMWLILAALGLAAAAFAAFLLLRRRPRDEEAAYEYRAEPEAVAPIRERAEPVVRPEPVREAPAAAAPRAVDPVAAAPLFVTRPETAGLNETARPPVEPPARPARKKDQAEPALENAELVTPDSADIDAVLGGARQHDGRPQLELAMRPTQAGMSSRGATVAFELTVANAGDTPAEDVRIGAFMLGDNAAAASEIERLLTNPPAGQVVPAERIEPGDGKQLNASVTLPREQVDAVAGDGHDFTPVLVADARYRLPDGSEGRTAAAFTIGRVNGGERLVPIALQDDPATYADIEARLHSVPAKV
ncbi:hypothetical protein OK349_15720 [Sphingomonas sp. BT-65]|uniref:hypothetical protein n=1 Tax=Sphingomonas sp. BT-65 TaxID=2989821 RepID=UPI0022367DE2|nr:hypothetical protein [Sphingomonas sp. BT-65]MCW4463160.1 hypothetical protein [Sphingomonas sp. BT-65]